MTRFLRQSYLSYKAQYYFVNPIIYFLMMVLNPTLQLSFFAIMVRFAYGQADISVWIIGNAFLLASMNSVFVIGTLVTRERSGGTLKYIMASPVSKFKIFLSRSILHVFDIGVRVVIGFIIGFLFFEFDLMSMNLPLLMLSIITGMLSGLGFGMLIGSFALITTEIHLFLNSIEQLLILFTGAIFAVTKLPSSVRWISNIVPLRRSIEASRILLGDNTYGFGRLIAEELMIAVGLIIAGYFIFELCSRLARKKALIDLY